MVTKKDFEKAGIKENYKLSLMLQPEGKHICYFMEFQYRDVAVANSVAEARAGVHSLLIPYRHILSCKVLRKDLEPITKKELEKQLIEKGSKLELTLSNGAEIIGFVKELERDCISLTPGWDKSGEPYRFNDGGVPGVEIKYRAIRSYKELGQFD